MLLPLALQRLQFHLQPSQLHLDVAEAALALVDRLQSAQSFVQPGLGRIAAGGDEFTLLAGQGYPVGPRGQLVALLHPQTAIILDPVQPVAGSIEGILPRSHFGGLRRRLG